MRRSVKDYLTSNWELKLTSFVLALVLWFILIPEEKTFEEKTLTVPLEIGAIPPQMELLQRPLQFVEVTVRAPSRLIPQISSTTVHAVLDLQKASVAQTRYSLNRDMVSLPAGAEVKEIYPSHVTLKIEATKEAMLDVEENLIGQLPDGYKLAKVEIIPPQVLVKGPESKITENIKVQTSPIDISTFTQPLDIEADLILPDPDLRLASSPSIVTVKLLIQENKETDEKTNE